MSVTNVLLTVKMKRSAEILDILGRRLVLRIDVIGQRMRPLELKLRTNVSKGQKFELLTFTHLYSTTHITINISTYIL